MGKLGREVETKPIIPFHNLFDDEKSSDESEDAGTFTLRGISL